MSDDKSEKAKEIEDALKADKARKDAEGDERFQALCDAVTTMTRGIESLSDRLDALEAKRNDGDDDLEDIDDIGKPRPVADADEPPHLMSEAQAKADAACLLFGMKAPPPMVGERLLAYRRRLLRPLQKHSPAYKDIDLDVASVDSPLFDAVEARIYADAEIEARRPTVPSGQLIERNYQKGAHGITEFYGDPLVWMSDYSGAARSVVGFGPTK